jgi:hypothetical protein
MSRAVLASENSHDGGRDGMVFGHIRVNPIRKLDDEVGATGAVRAGGCYRWPYSGKRR